MRATSIPGEGPEAFEVTLDARVAWLDEPGEEHMAEEILNNPLTEKFTEALTMACELHRTQARKSTQIPYVSHLLAVASLALEHGATEAQAIAAVLHDAIEDQPRSGATEAEILATFGQDILDIVLGCTQDKSLADGTEASWVRQREAYIAHLATASASVRLVSACDKLHNARAVLADYRVHGEALWTRFNGGRRTLWYYRALAGAFAEAEGRAGAERTPLVAELGRVVSKLEKVAAAG